MSRQTAGARVSVPAGPPSPAGAQQAGHGGSEQGLLRRRGEPRRAEAARWQQVSLRSPGRDGAGGQAAGRASAGIRRYAVVVVVIQKAVK